MGWTLAVANQKGGVGKTTTAVNLAAALAMRGVRVLLIDIDPQGSASTGVGARPGLGEPTVYDVLVRGTPAKDVLRRTCVDSLDVLPSNRDLVGADIELVGMEERETRLKLALAPLEGRYEISIIDCPPSLSLLTLNALVAANGVIVPLQAEYYALEGLSSLLDTIGRVRERFNPGLEFEGLVVTMFDRRNTLARQVRSEVCGHFGDRVFSTVVPRNVRLSESPSHGMPVLLYDPGSRGAAAYRRMGGEITERLAERRKAAAKAV